MKDISGGHRTLGIPLIVVVTQIDAYVKIHGTVH